jgi:hypothetical protein
MPTGQPIWAFGYLAVFALALVSLVTRRWFFAAVLWLFAIGTLFVGVLHSNVHYANPASSLSDQTVNGSSASLVSAAGLVVLTLMAIGAENIKPWARRIVAILMTSLVLLPLAVTSATAIREYQLRDDRVVPWLLDASSQQGSSLRMLVLQPSGKSFVAQWSPISGIKLEDANVSYRYALSSLNASQPGYGDLANLVAGLVSSTVDDAAIQSTHVGYVLVPNDQSAASAELSNALDSVQQLDPAGLTEFGRLWRVNLEVAPGAKAASSPWSVTKGVQLGILAAFLLLAIPTSGSSRRRAKEASIFIDSEGDAS